MGLCLFQFCFQQVEGNLWRAGDDFHKVAQMDIYETCKVLADTACFVRASTRPPRTLKV